jgi:hypothetical protein
MSLSNELYVSQMTNQSKLQMARLLEVEDEERV